MSGSLNSGKQKDAGETANLLSDARIALYPTSILGLLTSASTAATAGPGAPHGGFLTMGDLKDEMNLLADRTGGEAIFGTNDVAGAMRRTMDESALLRAGLHPHQPTVERPVPLDSRRGCARRFAELQAGLSCHAR